MTNRFGEASQSTALFEQERRKNWEALKARLRSTASACQATNEAVKAILEAMKKYEDEVGLSFADGGNLNARQKLLNVLDEIQGCLGRASG